LAKSGGNREKAHLGPIEGAEASRRPPEKTNSGKLLGPFEGVKKKPRGGRGEKLTAGRPGANRRPARGGTFCWAHSGAARGELNKLYCE